MSSIRWITRDQALATIIAAPLSRLKKYSPDSNPDLPHSRRLARFFHIPGLACPIGRFIALQRPLLPPFAHDSTRRPGLRPGGRLTLFVSPKKVSKKRRPDVPALLRCSTWAGSR